MHDVIFFDDLAGRSYKNFDDLECPSTDGLWDSPQPDFPTRKVDIPDA
jgi:hypothetical protein